MKIGIILDKKYKDYFLSIKQEITKLGHTAVLFNSSNFIENCELLTKAILNKKVDKGIAIDEYGTVPFMYIAKHKSIVVAQIADEHSAHMTCAHNNATVLAFGGEISTLSQINNMIASFINSTYEGGRHRVRLEMLDTLLKGEK